ncbi:MAG: hypothetical protein OXT74_13485 [Candidatus Poribacteria bacterium]|nr:hypothetical protein [Candidatus Poribacteria bacterium]
MKYDKVTSKKKLGAREETGTFLLQSKMKRLTIDVSANLHSAIKVECARKGVKMSDAIREILEHEFGKGE